MFASNFDPTTKIWSGRKQPSLLNPDISLGEACLKLMSRNPNHTVQIIADSGVSYTNEDVKRRAIRTVQFYTRQGLKPGDVVGMAARNSPNLSAITLASLISGIPFNSLDSSFVKSDIVHMFGITRPNLVFCDEINYEAITDALIELGLNSPVYIVDGNVRGVPKVTEFMETDDESWKRFRCPVLGSQSKVPASILCSSGTTGKPKAVVLSQASVAACSRIMNTNCDDRVLNFSSMYWLSGIMTLIVSLLNGSTKITSSEAVTPADILQIIETYKVTHYASPPSHMAQILQDPDLSAERLLSLRCYYVGGSMVPRSLSSKMQEYLQNGKVRVLYGLTELGNMCSIDGILFDNIQVRIVDAKGESLDQEMKGEIWIKSPHVFFGYVGNVEQTRAALDDDGWLHTGDIGFFDRNGRLSLVDRKKDILKYAMFHYSPSEIEDVILKLNGVAEVCVCGVTDAIGNDLPTALVKRTNGSTISEMDVLNFTSSRLADCKHLRGGVFFADLIPISASGKYKRNEVKDICTELYEKRNAENSNVRGG